MLYPLHFPLVVYRESVGQNFDFVNQGEQRVNRRRRFIVLKYSLPIR